VGEDWDATVQLIKISEQWKVNYKGSIEASVTAKIGAIINFVLVPGVFASFTPYIAGVASLSARTGLHFEKFSGDVDKIPTVAWPNNIGCLKNGPPATDFATLASEGGFSLANDSSPPGACVAAGLAFVTGLEVTAIGPPEGFDAKRMFKAICDEMIHQMAQTDPITTATLDCAGKELQLLGKNTTTVRGAFCRELIEAIPKNPLEALEMFEGEQCFDLFSQSIGTDRSCEANVGCQRRLSPQERQRSGGGGGTPTPAPKPPPSPPSPPPTPPMGTCRDQNANCRAWAQAGNCAGQHSQYMSKNCCASCSGGAERRRRRRR
jgi:hypothetical protein